MPKTSFLAQRALFKAYDIRGNAALFTPDFVKALGLAFAQDLAETAQARQVVIGYDVRHGSKSIAEQFVQSLCERGIEVIWLGLVTTPIMAFWANRYQGHGLIVTASHSEGHILGIKWLISGESPSYERIQMLYQRLISQQPADASTATSTNPAATPKVIAPNQVGHTYANSAAIAVDNIRKFRSLALVQHSLSQKMPDRLKVVIDSLNGATGPYVAAFFEPHQRLCDIILINKTPDGDFPKGNPDPMEDKRLTELSQAVIEHQADLGLAFDGDGDRLMVVDNQGHCLAPDHLLYLLARVSIEDHQPVEACLNAPAPIVLFDVKCTHHMPRLITALGAVPQMSKTGSSILRRTLQTKQDNNPDHAPILFAGELSGHFLFNDGYFLLHDDAMYAALRLLNWLQYQAQHAKPAQLTDILKTLPPMVSTPDVYLPLDAYEASPLQQNTPLLNKLMALCDKLSQSIELPKGAQLTCIDGLRLDFAHGFGIIRPSNTSNSLTVRFAGDSLSDLKSVQGYFVKLCHFINDDLAKQVANIQIKS